MQPASEPSPLSLGPPYRTLLPRPAASPPTTSAAISTAISTTTSTSTATTTANSVHNSAMADSIELTARYTMPSLPRPPIVQHLTVLNEFLGVRPKYPNKPKVIAIDGFDGNAVQKLIANLRNHLTRKLKCTVRVMDNDFTRVPVDRSTQLCGYMEQIHDWRLMWNKIAEAPSPSPLPTRAGPCAGPVIYLLPLSPLMATVRASNYLALLGIYGTVDHWRWLASHWSGHPRPDITINIEDMASVSTNREILRLQGSDMDTLIVTKGLDGGVDLGPQQLHRVLFEVGDWLISV